MHLTAPKHYILVIILENSYQYFRSVG